ncbi:MULTISPECIES: L-fucose:H+ symporter permease [Pseudomonas]|jgi:FHS family L-fucose permease-like MFS transporter|uniref:L-fucose:H+ symporter permease n=1 Tax=Pseudomonas TaxID=286 RepID=UPI001AE56B2D|nr:MULTISPECIES: L-fucose:H+ symporter permease [unclassified Pseudomonas]MBP1124545.1 FHS family L-fucose permease-like MFS transporter [Pseudomonas sp. PvP025]MDQ0398405.1 FHS family L-fucose permease-like MFS transporter [Pseudomonas sp. PvP006]MEB0105812.1 L-fucose:H+ symporter permease [Pseudomonas sp. MH9.3]WPX80108.1 L-fucose:H+ symporter permease [Pseudomonas sp. MH9.3]
MNKPALQQTPDGFYLNRTPWFAFILLCSIFALWAAAASMNDVLIAHFKKAFLLSDFQTAFVQSAFYLGYFFVAIPAAMVVRRFSYKSTILIGLLLYMLGCLLFFPAASTAKYGMFLLALFVIAAGLSFLETACNTYSTLMGPRETGTRRLNISQTFHPFGAMAGVYVGSFVMFKSTDATTEQLTQMSATEAAVQQLQMIQSTLLPYKWMIAVLVLMFILVAITRFPACKGNKPAGSKAGSSVRQSLGRLWRNPRFTFGVLAQFLYVGAQVGVWSFTIRLAMQMGGMNERSASWFLMTTFAAYFVGKMIANLLMRRLHPAKVLAIYGVLCIVLLAYTILVPNISAVYAAVGVSIFLGPCWPTIYGLTIDGLGEDTGVGGSLLVMSIVGGGVIPIFQGLLSDASGGNMQLAYSVPLLCFIVIVIYALKCMRQPGREPLTAAGAVAS